MYKLFLFFSLKFLVCDCASISNPKENDTLGMLQEDISLVGGSVQTLAFDFIRSVLKSQHEDDATYLQDSEESSGVHSQKKRSADGDLRELCHKEFGTCNGEDSAELQQIVELKEDVKKLRNLIGLIRDQQVMIKILDEQQKREVSGPLKASDELLLIKRDLKEAITSLNETREVIRAERKKEQVLEKELKRQKAEMRKLRVILDGNQEETVLEKQSLKGNQQARASEDFTELRKLLAHSKSEDSDGVSDLRKLLVHSKTEDGDGVSSSELQTKVRELEDRLKKMRQQQSLATELKQLEKHLNTEEDTQSNGLLKQMIQAMIKSEMKQQGRGGDDSINDLSSLQDAINKLRPKEDSESAQFQAMFNKLVNNQASGAKPQPTIFPQVVPGQIPQAPTQWSPSSSTPMICYVDDGSYRAPPPSNNYGFFPKAQYSPPAYYAPPDANGGVPQKPVAYQQEVSDGAKYQEDLSNQIEGLQAAIDGMNRPEYVQKPEDKEVIDGLERQIGELRAVVQNLHQTYPPRSRRSTEDNNIDGGDFVDTMVDLMGNLVNNSTNQTTFREIQKKIDSLKNELDGSNKRTATADYYPNYQQPYSNSYQPPSIKDLKKGLKNDIFSEIVSKILDKLLDTLPLIVGKLFNFSFEELSRNDYQDYEVQSIFKNLGIFAFIPVILLRIIRGITYFLGLLKKNSFFKNFGMPALILGIIAGSVFFLIWWLQPDGQSQYSPPNIEYKPNNDYNNYPAQEATPNYPTYSRSYFNK